MKPSQTSVNHNLSHNPKQIITRCVEEFEARTQVELVVLIKPHSQQYWGFFWFYTLMCVQIFWISTILWNDSFEYELTALESWVLVALCYVIFIKFNVIKYLVSSKIKKASVQDLATKEFCHLGIFNTKRRSGLLIVYTHLENECLLLADKGVKEKISEKELATWTAEFKAAFNSKDLGESLGSAIRSFGVYWHTQWPNEDDENEIVHSTSGVWK